MPFTAYTDGTSRPQCGLRYNVQSVKSFAAAFRAVRKGFQANKKAALENGFVFRVVGFFRM
jgi:hypothetical protein